MSSQGIDQLLGELRSAAALAKGKSTTSDASDEAAPVDFAKELKAALDQVNTTQHTANENQQQFEMGDPAKNLPDVMVSLQKASLSFQTMIQVRNKLVSAYQDIMNTQV